MKPTDIPESTKHQHTPVPKWDTVSEYVCGVCGQDCDPPTPAPHDSMDELAARIANEMLDNLRHNVGKQKQRAKLRSAVEGK